MNQTLSTKVDANGMGQVMFLVIKSRTAKRFRVKSGVYVYADYWNENKHGLTIPYKIDIKLKRELQEIRDNLETAENRVLKLIEIFGEQATKEFIENILTSLKDYDGILTREVVNEELKAIQEKVEQEQEEKAREERIVYNFFVPYIEAKEFSIVRERMVKGVFRSMERFDIFRNRIAHRHFEWDIDKVTNTDIEDLFTFFADEHLHRKKYAKVFNSVTLLMAEERKTKRKETIEERGENRLVDMRKCVKAFWNWLLKTRKTTNNPFVGVEIGVQKYGTPFYITTEERNQIADFDFSGKPHLEIQRDIFVFQCLVGCRIGDLTQLKRDNIVDDMLVYTPHKTKDETESFVVRVPLNDKAKELIEKYKDTPLGRLFPFIADQSYNEAIKTILTTCDITRKVNVRNPKTGENEMIPINEICSSHMARRTFVGNAYKQVKDPNLIGRMSGHKEGSKAFARYRDIDDDMLRDVIKKME